MSFAAMIAAAERDCGGRIVFAHEGGYSKEYVPFCGLAVIEELLGKRADPPVVDPLLWEVDARGYQALQPHQAVAIERAMPDFARLATGPGRG